VTTPTHVYTAVTSVIYAIQQVKTKNLQKYRQEPKHKRFQY